MLIIPMVIIPIIIAGSLSAILWSGGEQFAFKWLNPRGSHHSHGDPGLIIFNSWLITLSELFVQSFSVQRIFWEFLECIIFWMIFPSQGLYQNFLNELSFEWFFPPLVFMQLFEYLCNYLNIYEYYLNYLLNDFPPQQRSSCKRSWRTEWPFAALCKQKKPNCKFKSKIYNSPNSIGLLNIFYSVELNILVVR